jgi:hypothetical protein
MFMNIRDIIAYFDSLNDGHRQSELEILNRLYPAQQDRGMADGQERSMEGHIRYTPHGQPGAYPYPQQGNHKPFAQPYDVGAYGCPQQPQTYLDPRTGQRHSEEHYTAPANIPPVEPLPKACEPSMSKVPCIVLEVSGTGELVQLSKDASEEFLIWKSKQGRYGWYVRLERAGLILPNQAHYVPDNYRPLVLQVNSTPGSSRVVMVHPSATRVVLPEGKNMPLGHPGIIEITRHGYNHGEIAGYNTYTYPYGPESTSEAGAVAYTRVLERLARLYDGDIERDRILEKEVEDFSFGDEGLVDENKRNRIHLHRQDFYRLIREMGLYKEIGSGIQWVEGWAEGKSVSGALYRRHLSTFIRNGGEVGYENNQFYVAYSK